MPEPDKALGDVLVDGLAVGVCGTDHELADGDYGWAPEGSERLILGHESLGRVREAPEGSGFAEGDLIVVLEAMKMEQPINAHKAGTISGLTAEVGMGVTSGEVIATIADAAE